MKRTPTTIQPMPDRFVPSGRTVHPLSTRCCVGEHPSGRGRRVDGYMLVRIRHEYHAQAFVRELDVNEAFTMRELYDIISLQVAMEEGFPPPKGCAIDPQVGGGMGIIAEPADALVTDYLDGGEDITVKVYDNQGHELRYVENQGWGVLK